MSDRHYLRKLRPNHPVKESTTFIPPELEDMVEAEREEINRGHATRSLGNWYTVSSGRIYVDKGNGNFFPKSGPGFVGPVNRGTNRVLSIFSRYNGASDQALYRLSLEKGIESSDVELAMEIWSLFSKRNP